MFFRYDPPIQQMNNTVRIACIPLGVSHHYNRCALPVQFGK